MIYQTINLGYNIFMLLYGVIIAIYVLISIVTNGVCAFVFGYDLVNAVYWMIVTFAALLGIDIVVVVGMRIFPKKIFYNPNRRIYQTKPWQTSLFLKLGIRSWKERVPELGGMGGFKKDKLYSFETDYLERFLYENCFGEAEHVMSGLASFLVLLYVPNIYLWTIAFPFAVCNLMLNWMSAMIQRYLRPKLMALYRRQKRKNENEGVNPA